MFQHFSIIAPVPYRMSVCVCLLVVLGPGKMFILLQAMQVCDLFTTEEWSCGSTLEEMSGVCCRSRDVPLILYKFVIDEGFWFLSFWIFFQLFLVAYFVAYQHSSLFPLSFIHLYIV